MAFDSLAELLAMGRHGPYVWSAWGISLGLLGLSLLLVWRESRQVRRMLRRQLKREAAVQFEWAGGTGAGAVSRKRDESCDGSAAERVEKNES